jgi:hypothetical protein
MGTPWVKPNDTLVSFDVVFLFTKVLIKDSSNILSRQFDEDNVRLLRHVLVSPFFCFNGKFYEQTNGVAMGSPLSSVTANNFMEYSEEVALSRAGVL